MKGNAEKFVEKVRTVLNPIAALPYDERKKQLSEWRTPMPLKLYHYRGADDERNLRDLLVDSRLFLRSAADFNDPFECRFQFGKLGDTTTVYDYFVKTATAQGASASDIRNIAAGMIKTGRDGIEKAAINDTNARLQAVGIFCLCESYKDVLMWAHYGQSHRGVCVEIDVAHGVSTFGLCKKVRYDGPMPTLDYPDTDPTAIAQPMLRKAAPWHYEQEWRIAIPSGSHQHLDFPPPAVTSVTYGCETNSKTRDLVAKLLKERTVAGYPPVLERQLARAEREYLLVDC